METRDAQAPSRPAAGVFWMLVTGLCFVAVTGLVKHGVPEVPAPQAAFLRFVFGAVFVLPALGAVLRTRLSPVEWRLVALRGLAHSVAVMFWFHAMTRITVAEVTSMNYLTPVFVTIGAALFLGERVALRRILAISVAFLGMLLILRPGLREISDGHLAMIGTAVLLGVSYLVAKKLSGSQPPHVVVGLMTISVMIGLAPFAIAVWEPPTGAEYGWLVAIAGFATAGHYTMTRAFAVAPVAVTQPVTFLQLVWAALLGLVVFGEAIDPWVVAGGALIVGAVTFLTIREAMLKRRAEAAP